MRLIVNEVEQNVDRGYQQVSVTVEREDGTLDGHVELIVSCGSDSDEGPWKVELFRATRGGNERLWTGEVEPYPAPAGDDPR